MGQWKYTGVEIYWCGMITRVKVAEATVILSYMLSLDTVLATSGM